MKFAYHVRSNEENSILIEDLCNHVGCMSLTNAAEDVIVDLHRLGLIQAGKKVFYIDTDGRRDELCHDGNRFTGFACGS